MRPIRIRTFYPADPVGIVPGGVDTFIRGIVKWAPDDLEFSVIGMTTNPVARPAGQWTRCGLGRREFDFFPVVSVANAGQRSSIPLSLRYTGGLARHHKQVRGGFDAFEFHRVEPALLFARDGRPKNAFFHQDMAVIRTEKKADILWRHLPGMYFRIERHVVNALSSAWCVRQEGVRAMQERFPAKASVIHFVPTWVDTEVFSPMASDDRRALRSKLAREIGVDEASAWVVSVGRLDTQKDPERLLAAFARLALQGRDVSWLVVGDGVLRDKLQKGVAAAGLQRRVHFLGLKRPQAIADLLRAADVFALSSAYEGMPMAVLEALGSGLPVATTDVGEVRKAVIPGVNGAIAADHSVEAFEACLADVLDNREAYGGAAAVAAIQPYRPAMVLTKVYDNYRELGLRYRMQNNIGVAR